MNWLKIYLPVYLILYLLVTFVLPTYRTYKQTGINPLAFGKSDNAQDYIGLEEEFLTKEYGTHYQEYKQKTKRLL